MEPLHERAHICATKSSRTFSYVNFLSPLLFKEGRPEGPGWLVFKSLSFHSTAPHTDCRSSASPDATHSLGFNSKFRSEGSLRNASPV